MTLDSSELWAHTRPLGVPFALTACLAPVLTSIHHLLGMRFLPGSPGDSTEIGRMVLSFYQALAVGDVKEAEMYLLRLLGLVTQLQVIREHSEDMFLAFKKRLHLRCPSDYRGAMFEIAVAGQLASVGVPLRKCDPPDFRATFAGSEVLIECKSIRIRAGAAEDEIRSGLRRAVAGKAAKPYAAGNSVLFVEGTSVQHGLVKLGLDPAPVIESVVRREVDRAAFGAVGVFVTTVRPTSYCTEWIPGANELVQRASVYRNRATIDDALSGFLDRFMPMRRRWVEGDWAIR